MAKREKVTRISSNFADTLARFSYFSSPFLAGSDLASPLSGFVAACLDKIDHIAMICSRITAKVVDASIAALDDAAGVSHASECSIMSDMTDYCHGVLVSPRIAIRHLSKGR